ncbi:amidase [Flavihumibacter petaseus]|uniref:Putative glutamyl-tRNA(Gln) amidotransferase subunit A n=1 Tax=Flavihumibacter petaseus NBRC 106054 TaxID=1220578 RepID=A0A0E9N3M4_9BACT|nr:amidase [Flavihumibacter petaseus]GAO44582.1 putative glutamyl-tRNA(Gln) amidotransferase subunit A [Flavihumibacter petaseus NBRC 106054]
MKRRNFLRDGSLASLAMAGLAITACQNTSDAKKDSKDTASNESSKSDQSANDDLNETTVRELQRKMEAGVLTATSLTEVYLRRIREIDQGGPKLRAVIELNPDALSIARAMDAERAAGKTRGLLHGIPVLIKDNIDTADSMQTTAGALAMEGNKASKDAFLVTRLREAGAVLLGKTNLSEWANFRSSSSCSGWSSRGGQTLNPYLLSHNPCGSSSGSGVAVAANLCAIAVGTETDGSITCPASVNGVVGLKPTVGLVSRSGIIPISHTQDTAGPLTRTVEDTAILLNYLVGADAADNITVSAAANLEKDYTRFLQTDALKGKRIGIEKKPQGKNQFMHRLLEKAKDTITQAGGTIVDIEYLDSISKLGDAEFTVMKYEFKSGVNKYLAAANGKMKSLQDVIAFNKANEDKAMPYFKQETLESSQELGDLEQPDYLKALKECHDGSKQILDKVILENKLDAIAGITMGPACAVDRWYGDRWGDVFLTQPAAISGYPHISVPCGMVYGLPVGFSFFSKAFSEGPLLGMAYAFEQMNKARVHPAFTPAIPQI